MARLTIPELMDLRSPDRSLLTQALDDLAWLNRYLGGTAGVLHPLSQLLAGYEGSELRVLDVGAGGGDMLMAVGRWCERHGRAYWSVALDFGAETTRIAAANLKEWGVGERIRALRGDARQLPFSDGAFEVAYSNTFLHHLDPEDAVLALREMARVSSWGVIVSDLRRGIGGYLAAWILARTVWRRHPYTCHDGPASMRAAYTLGEVRSLAERAGLEAEVKPQPAFRWALSWERAK